MTKFSQNETNFSKIEKVIKYKFKDKNYLYQALMHKSAIKDDSYERLEFLGDRVLGLVVSEELYKNFPNENEGNLTKLFHKNVNKFQLSNIMKKLNINHFITMENGNQIRKLDSIQSDVLEALIAAIYLDGGLNSVKKFILNNWNLKNQNIHFSDNYKSTLQEWSVANSFPIPEYNLINKDGPDHNPSFEVSVSIGKKYISYGSGNSLKEAEKKAAKLMLEKNIFNFKIK